MVCGGSGFYVRNFICGLPERPLPIHRSGKASRGIWPSWGAASLRAELAAADPDSAARIHDNDAVSPNARPRDRPAHRQAHGGFRGPAEPRPGRRFLVLGIAPPPSELGRRGSTRASTR